MFRVLWFGLGAVTVGCALAYFVSGKERYLRWARRCFVLSLAAGVFFFTVLLIKRLI